MGRVCCCPVRAHCAATGGLSGRYPMRASNEKQCASWSADEVPPTADSLWKSPHGPRSGFGVGVGAAGWRGMWGGGGAGRGEAHQQLRGTAQGGAGRGRGLQWDFRVIGWHGEDGRLCGAGRAEGPGRTDRHTPCTPAGGGRSAAQAGAGRRARVRLVRAEDRAEVPLSTSCHPTPTMQPQTWGYRLAVRRGAGRRWAAAASRSRQGRDPDPADGRRTGGGACRVRGCTRRGRRNRKRSTPPHPTFPQPAPLRTARPDSSASRPVLPWGWPGSRLRAAAHNRPAQQMGRDGGRRRCSGSEIFS